MIYVWTPLLFILTDAQFISSPTSTCIKCTGEELDLPWTYNVTTYNASSVKWTKDGLTMLKWIVAINNYGYENRYHSNKIVHHGHGNVVIKALASSDAGEYVCEIVYTVNGNKFLSTGVTLAVSSSIKKLRNTLLCFIGIPAIITAVILIIMYCCCNYPSSQKVDITVTADKQMKSAKQKINEGNQQQIPITQNKICSIVAYGEETHDCEFETDAGVLKLKFMIKDDLLNVKPGHTITLPTVLDVDPTFSTIKRFHNGNAFENDSEYFTTRVTMCTYSVYDIKMTFENLGLTILIKKMRVQGIYWMFMGISVGCNVICDVIGGAIAFGYRSTDGFCVTLGLNFAAILVPMFVVNLLVVAFVYFLFMKRKRKRNKQSIRRKGQKDTEK